MNELQTQIQELKNDLKEIKKTYAIFNDDMFWRYEYRSLHKNYNHFTHIYCTVCKYVASRNDKKTINCFMNHHPSYHLVKCERKF
jgi:hypothetical protein